MGNMNNLKPYNVSATLKYLRWQKLYESEKPYQIYCPIEESDIQASNLSFEKGPVEIVHDARHTGRGFHLDRNGFTVVEHDCDPSWFKEPETIERHYLPAISQLLKNSLGNDSKVYIFEYQVMMMLFDLSCFVTLPSCRLTLMNW